MVSQGVDSSRQTSSTSSSPSLGAATALGALTPSPWRWAFVASVNVGGALVLVAAALWLYVQSTHLTLRDELEARDAEIAQLDVQRSGRVQLIALRPSEGGEQVTKTRLGYAFVAPWTNAEDTEIRGLLDGTTKHRYNQGTAFHIRLGRRYTGLFDGQFELKRGLYKWPIELPDYVQVVDVRAQLWVEAFFENSPLVDGHALPLHVYGYPLTDQWGPGKGGVQRDTLSAAAPGESNWLTAQEGTQDWAVPGALLRRLGEGSEQILQPIGRGVVHEGERPLNIVGGGMVPFVQRCLHEGRSVDLLLKLDDREEDTAGTQFALLTSDFGDHYDTPSKRPTLHVEVEVEGRSFSEEVDFVLEEGAEIIGARQDVRGSGPLLLAHEWQDSLEPGQIRAEVSVRGGKGNSSSEWQHLRNPIEIDESTGWEWVQFRVSTAVRRIERGDPFRAELLEPWVKPGPRAEQVPLLLAIAPSGKRHFVQGQDVGELRFRMEFVPDEVGLWRYAWTFHAEPISAPFSHQGQGVFTLSARVLRDATELRQRADELVDSLSGKTESSASDQLRINRFVRQAAEFGARGAREREQMETIMTEVKGKLPRQYAPR